MIAHSFTIGELLQLKFVGIEPQPGLIANVHQNGLTVRVECYPTNVPEVYAYKITDPNGRAVVFPMSKSVVHAMQTAIEIIEKPPQSDKQDGHTDGAGQAAEPTDQIENAALAASEPGARGGTLDGIPGQRGNCQAAGEVRSESQ